MPLPDATPLPPDRRATRLCEIVFPEDTNPYGKMFGGRALQLMDKAAGVAATRYCHHHVVTACSDRVDFAVPIPEGALIEFVARVVWTGHSSMVVKVELYNQGRRATECGVATSGYFTMVAVDKGLRPQPVVEQLVPETDAEKIEWEKADRVRQRH